MTETEIKSMDNHPKSNEFIAKITLFQAVLLALGNILGAGIYVLVSSVYQKTGPAIIVVFAIDLFVACLIAGCYAECVSIHPVSGGGFVYIKEAFGEKALLIGWIIWLSNMAYGAICAITIGIFLADLLNYQQDWFIFLVSMLAVISFTLLNAGGSDTLNKIQTPLVFALMGTFILGAVYLFVKPSFGSFTPFLPFGVSSLFYGAALFLDVFIGFEDTCAIAEEIQNPRRNVPKTLFLAILICAIFYFLVIIAIIYSLPQNIIRDSQLAFIEGTKDNELIYFFIFIGAIFALLTSVGGAIMASSRNLYALAKFDFIDRKWGEINEKYNVPLRAILLSAFLCIMILVSGQVEYIASISNISYILSVICVALTTLKFRKTKEYTQESFKIPFYPYSIYLTIFLCSLLVFFIDPDSILVALAWFLIGIIIYLFFSSKNRVIGTVFLVLLFLISLTYIFVGIILLIAGILFYLFRIANINSKSLTLAGMKIFNLLFLWFLWANSQPVEGTFSIYYIIPISFGIALLSIIFDVIPLREIMHYIEIKRNARNVPMAGIVLYSKDKTKFMDQFNTILYFIVMGISTILFVVFILFLTNTIQFNTIGLLSGYITNDLLNFLYAGILLLSSLILFVSAYNAYIINKESHKIDKL